MYFRVTNSEPRELPIPLMLIPWLRLQGTDDSKHYMWLDNSNRSAAFLLQSSDYTLAANPNTRILRKSDPQKDIQTHCYSTFGKVPREFAHHLNTLNSTENLNPTSPNLNRTHIHIVILKCSGNFVAIEFPCDWLISALAVTVGGDRIAIPRGDRMTLLLCQLSVNIPHS